ncbi:MAG: potassium channel family protein [Altererythrobacter sp.]|uniref:potassium channel family protein n=1 Tax=uncultured Altererythrobacter sp. TaxID=500840 RepID=UPI0017900CEB|nr:potassium channel family protein [uncultured Altererythrobacter sp.]MBT8388113.1 potassium channel family protein [Altererythrobacter sp.]NNE49678.1 potassium channel family protein [Altererythrobacter sp.]NNF94308.1 potassium channel family protein [Altererythrobacter sp.]NNK47133.1 potassium channel family protein [Altererythrobacter sp.]
MKKQLDRIVPTPSQRRARGSRFQPLRRAVNVPVWGDLSIRLGLALLLLSIVVLIHWWDRGGLTDAVDGDVSFLDVVYFTMISVTTTGFGDITPVTDRARMVEAIIVTPIRFAVFFIFVGTAYNFIIKRSWEKWRMARIQENLEGHIIVLGFGISGSESVNELIERGTDARNIVVVDPSEERLKEAEKLGCNVIAADATRDSTLEAVRIRQARNVLVSAGRDDTSILIVLTVRHLAPDVPISVVVRADDNEILARQAGANNVINPVRFTGLLLAGSAKGAHIADYLADLASVTGRVQLVERKVTSEEAGKSIGELSTGGRGLRVYRGGRVLGFWEDECQQLEAGDVVVEIVPTTNGETNGDGS